MLYYTFNLPHKLRQKTRPTLLSVCLSLSGAECTSTIPALILDYYLFLMVPTLVKWANAIFCLVDRFCNIELSSNKKTISQTLKIATKYSVSPNKRKTTLLWSYCCIFHMAYIMSTISNLFPLWCMAILHLSCAIIFSARKNPLVHSKTFWQWKFCIQTYLSCLMYLITMNFVLF